MVSVHIYTINIMSVFLVFLETFDIVLIFPRHLKKRNLPDSIINVYLVHNFPLELQMTETIWRS